jgi:hypothetical protein
MAHPTDASLAHHKTESTSFFAKAESELADFGEGLYHGAIESPIDGAIQLTNHLAGTHLPELHLVDEKRLAHSAGGVLGNIIGTAVDVYLASVATAGIAGAAGGSGMIGAALRFGAVGAAYTTILQPTDGNSKHFFRDRLENGAVAMGTFAAMGGAGAALDATGVFAVSAARSLPATLAYGGLVGAAGGLAHAEANAVIKEHTPVPKLTDLGKDVESYAAFGMAFSGAGYLANRLTSPAPRTFKTEDSHSMTVTTDKQGNPVKIVGDMPALRDPSIRLGSESTKMTDGTWSSSEWGMRTSGKGPLQTPMAVQDVKIDGQQLTVTGNGTVRTFTDGGAYSKVVPESWDEPAEPKAPKYSKSEYENHITTDRNYDEQGRLKLVHTYNVEGDRLNDIAVNYGTDGKVSEVFAGNGDINLRLDRNSGNEWDGNNSGLSHLYDFGKSFTWKGEVNVIPSAGPGIPEQIQYIPATGEQPWLYNAYQKFVPPSFLLQPKH